MSIGNREEISMYENRVLWGNKLFISAWVVEIIAAFIGLIIAWSMGFQTYQVYAKEDMDFPIGRVFDLFLAALPFVMVASVELLKIPFAYLIYINPDRTVKIIFSLVLVLVTFITFETLLTGFERQYANITTQVDIPRNKLVGVENIIIAKEKEISELKEFTIDSINEEISALREQVEKSLEDDLSNLGKRKSDYLASGNSDLIKQKLAIEEDIKVKVKERDDQISSLQKLLQNQVQEERENKKSSKKSNQNQINELRKEKREKELLIERKGQDLGMFSGFSSDIQSLKSRVAKINKTIDTLVTENSNLTLASSSDFGKQSTAIYNQYALTIDKLYHKISAIRSKMAKNSQFESEIQGIEKQEQLRRKRYSKALAKIDAKRVKKEDKLKYKESRIEKLQSELLPLKDKQLQLENEVLTAYSGTQIYRIARTFYSVERGHRITEKQISFVATVWFGSLAGIVSTMGVFLAFGSFILKYPKDPNSQEFKGNQHGVFRTFRRMMVALTRRLRKPKIITKIIEKEIPKEVIKEVPVDKVVFKEVPVEVVKKEVIHIPIYTNDPDLLKK